MKKLLLFILSVLLSGCLESNVIEVKHSDDFTSELIGEIELYSSKSEYSVNLCDNNNLCIYEYYMDKVDKNYQIDLNTNEIIEIDEKTIDENIESLKTYMFDNGFKIYRERTHVDHIYTTTYYYEKDGIKTKLIERVNDLSNDSYNSLKVTYDTNGKDFFFFIEKNDYMSINQVIDGKLEEIDQIPLIDQGIQLLYINPIEEGLCYHYENDEMIRNVLNGEELILKKIDGDKKLISWSINGIVPEQLVYEEKGIITLHINNEVYELGINSDYLIRDDYILYTAWREDFSGKDTFYLDRNENKRYILSEYLDFTSHLFSGNVHLSYLPNDKTPYKIVFVDHKDITAISLPFPADFEYHYLYDEHTIVFIGKEGNVLQFYKVKF